jgi:hypothetical protein
MKNNLLFSIVLVGSIWSCNSTPGELDKNKETAYFPLKEFIEVQALKLDGHTIRKQVQINGQSEKIESRLTEDELIKELEFFIKADISSASLASSYETQRSEEFLIHQLKPGENGRIQKIVVKYQGDKVREISFHAKTENMIYASESRGVLSTHAETGLIDHYTIDNTQEVVFLKSNKLLIFGSVFPS